MVCNIMITHPVCAPPSLLRAVALSVLPGHREHVLPPRYGKRRKRGNQTPSGIPFLSQNLPGRHPHRSTRPHPASLPRPPPLPSSSLFNQPNHPFHSGHVAAKYDYCYYFHPPLRCILLTLRLFRLALALLSFHLLTPTIMLALDRLCGSRGSGGGGGCLSCDSCPLVVSRSSFHLPFLLPPFILFFLPFASSRPQSYIRFFYAPILPSIILSRCIDASEAKG